MRENEERCVSLTGNKTKAMQLIAQSSVPCARRLLQTIERTLKLANMLGITRILKTRRLLHIHIFLKKSMKERIADINLAKAPPTRHSK
jgi:hypothetical protein